MSTPIETTLPGACLVSSAGDSKPPLLGGAGPGAACREGLDPSWAHNPAPAGSNPAPAPDLASLARWFFRAGGAATMAEIHQESGTSFYALKNAGLVKPESPGRWCERYVPTGALAEALAEVRRRCMPATGVEAAWANYIERTHGAEVEL